MKTLNQTLLPSRTKTIKQEIDCQAINSNLEDPIFTLRMSERSHYNALDHIFVPTTDLEEYIINKETQAREMAAVIPSQRRLLPFMNTE